MPLYPISDPLPKTKYLLPPQSDPTKSIVPSSLNQKKLLIIVYPGYPTSLNDLFQAKTDLFFTRAFISVHFKTVHYFSQPFFSLFSYLKNAQHNLVIGLCLAPFLFSKILYRYLLNSRTVL